MQQQYLIALFVIIVFGFLVDQVLDYLNSQKPKLLPAPLKEYYTDEEYRKSLAYKKEHRRLSNTSSWLSFIITLGFLLNGGFGWLNEFLMSFGLRSQWLSLTYFGVLFIVSDLLSTPLSLYSTFIIEEKYGFNKTTLKTFFLDKLKGYLLAIVLGGSLIAAFLWFIKEQGQSFWIYAWLMMIGVMLFMNFFYTTLFLPLFNKLNPLEEGPLKEAIVKLSKEVDFPLNKIYVMNASKRSTKSNAFFSGFGRLKSIVLFDTLLEKHSTEELLGILAHEVGHYKKKHVVINMVTSILTNGLMLFILSRFVVNTELSQALGASKDTVHINIIAFGILFGPINMVLGLLGNIFSRKHEYEADAFAIAHADKEAFQKALKKLSTENLSDLQPHPAYVFMHYSHPPLLQRLKAITDRGHG